VRTGLRNVAVQVVLVDWSISGSKQGEGFSVIFRWVPVAIARSGSLAKRVRANYTLCDRHMRAPGLPSAPNRFSAVSGFTVRLHCRGGLRAMPDLQGLTSCMHGQARSVAVNVTAGRAAHTLCVIFESVFLWSGITRKVARKVSGPSDPSDSTQRRS